MSTLKLALLSFKRNISCFYKDKRIFTFCVVLQIIISFSCIICFAYLFDSTRIQAEKRSSVREYEIYFEPDKDMDSMERQHVFHTITQNPFVSPQQIVWRFSPMCMDTQINAMAFSDVSALTMGVKGTKINQSENSRLERILLFPINAEPDGVIVEMKKSSGIGQKINLSGNEYEVRGVQNFYSYEAVHIPLAAGLKDFKLDFIKIILPAKTDNVSKQYFSKYLTGQLPDARITMPLSVDERAWSGVSIFIFAGIIASGCALLTFAQMYLYFVRRDHYEYVVMLVCGCSKSAGKWVILLQFTLLFSISYAFSVLLAQTVLYTSNRPVVPFAQIGGIWLVFTAILIGIMLPLLSKNDKWIRERKVHLE